MKMLLLLSLRGNAFVYQGEELGLTQVDVPSSDWSTRKRSPTGR